MTDPTPEAIEDYRQRHIVRLLSRVLRQLGTESLRRLHARGHTQLTPAHIAVLPHIDLAGTRPTVLAERADMSKQAAGQLVAELEARGYLRRLPDPADRRASLVGFTDLGRQFLRDAFDLKHELEAEYRAILGDARFEALQGALEGLAGG
jgi:DNA-binding MarR family transcriptional regulator